MIIMYRILYSSRVFFCTIRFDVDHSFAKKKKKCSQIGVFTYVAEVFFWLYLSVLWSFFIFGFNIHWIIRYQWCICFSFWEIKNYICWHIVNMILVYLISTNTDVLITMIIKILKSYLRSIYLGLYKCGMIFFPVVLFLYMWMKHFILLHQILAKSFYTSANINLLHLQYFIFFVLWCIGLSLSNSTNLVSLLIGVMLVNKII